ncbi:hypothetical protein [Paenibacillus sp. y28]|uniref:hypothetical protein n=1 Tax=Paenibacillus sp. y28 TaxID=3129110 RepID=UPI0030165F1C
MKWKWVWFSSVLYVLLAIQLLPIRAYAAPDMVLNPYRMPQALRGNRALLM